MSRVRWRACKARRRRGRERCRRGTRVRPGAPRWRSCKRRRLAATVGSTTCWALTCAAAASLYSRPSPSLSPSLHLILFSRFLSLSSPLWSLLTLINAENAPTFCIGLCLPNTPLCRFYSRNTPPLEIRNLLHEPGFSYLRGWGLIDFGDR